MSESLSVVTDLLTDAEKVEDEAFDTLPPSTDELNAGPDIKAP